MALNEEQSQALQVVLQGHNLLLMGAAGTGKSHVVRSIAKELRAKKKNVQVTATTGIACSVYSEAMTVHKWSGIGDGRYEPELIGGVVKNNVKFCDVRKRVMDTDILVVDECSMMSRRMFDSLSEVCKLKNHSLPFGGIQLVFCGDFRQLPPVPNRLYGEDGEFCYKHPDFNDVFPHRIILETSLRQDSASLITAIRETSTGQPTATTVDLIKGLQRPLQHLSSTKLYSTNEQVDAYNRQCVVDFPGDLHEYEANDEGQLGHLATILAPKKLWVKEGVPVILLRNLSDKLVNGLHVRVVGLSKKGPVVHFPTVQTTIPVEKFRFSVYSPSKNTDVAVREQYPIKLAFAMTIHKAQGLTLDNVEVDCRGIFKPGQLSVAMGRVRSTVNLRVINFSAQTCKPQPDHVNTFLAVETKILEKDRHCCVLKSRSVQQTEADIYSVTDIQNIEDIEASEVTGGIDVEEEFDEDFDNAILNLMQDEFSNIELPADLDLDGILEGIVCQTTETPIQLNTNRILRGIDCVKYRTFVKKVYGKISALMASCLPGLDAAQPVPSKQQDEFYKKVRQYLTSAEHRMNSMELFDASFKDDHVHICYDIACAIREFLIAKKVDQYPSGGEGGSMRQVTSASHSRIRYIAGYCVAKTRYKLLKQKRSHMYDTSAVGQTAYEEASTAVRILNSLRVDEHFILGTTTDPYSLEDIQRKQNVHHSLTHVSDDLQEVFKQLTEKGLALLTEENLNKKGSDLFQYLYGSVMSDAAILQQFEDLVKLHETGKLEFEEVEVNVEVRTEQTYRIYSKFVKQLLMVLTNQFRKDIMEKLKISKKMAHRKQIQVSSGSASTKKKRKTSQSTSKAPEQPVDRMEIEGEQPVASSSKETHVQPVASSSEETRVEEEVCEAEDDDLCSKCHTTGSDTQYVQCDGCSIWLHRSCAGLKHHMKWRKATKKGAKFYCPECQS